MPARSTQEIEASMQALREKYRQKLTEKIKQIEQLIKKYADLNKEEDLLLLRHMLHQLAGSAGMYGYAKLGQFSHQAERLLSERPSFEEIAKLQIYFEQIKNSSEVEDG
jgi:HPt (histidine-containing phosphotransfer) domain-containing protein